VRFDVVVERLTPFPEWLPPPAANVVPVVLDERLRALRTPPEHVTPRPAAVLVLVHPGPDGDARVVLTERATRDGHHSGEVSFPGGRAEPGDGSVAETALREAFEEVALDAVTAGVRVLGRLERFWIPVSNFEVTPVVAVTDREPVLRASEAEVARIVHAPLAGFLPDAPVRIVERVVRDWPIRYGVFDVGGLSVWGATARILSQLGAVVAGPAGRAADEPGGPRS
jgi:8-oxo-dGTP pyrophosphatase MutT (NUDIX family)